MLAVRSHGYTGRSLGILALGVAGADDRAAPESAAADHGRVAQRVVMPPAVPRGSPVDLGRAAELAVPEDDRALQQPPLRQVFHQAGETLVEHGEVRLHGPEVVGVGVPPAPVDRDERDAVFHQAAGQEATTARR